MLRLDAALLSRVLTRVFPRLKLSLMIGTETRSWHHRPAHVFLPRATYMVTAGTHHKQRFFHDIIRLRFLYDLLLDLAEKYGWQLQAWAVFNNHYHWVGTAPEDAISLKKFVGTLHMKSATEMNRLDKAPGRKVWFQYWDTCLTYERGYLGRLNYVHNNAVHHKLVPLAEEYEFCSARWFAAQADPIFRRKVASFRYDRLNVPDDF